MTAATAEFEFTMLPRRRIVLVLIPAGIVIATVGLAVLAALRGPPVMPEPVPNAYYDFTRAAACIYGQPGTYRDLNATELAQLVNSNTAALALVRQGLKGRSAMPFHAALTNFTSVSTNLIGFKNLALLLVAEGRLAELEGRPIEAARNYAEAIRLGNEISRGGLLIDRLVGVAMESIGALPLGRLLPNLDHRKTRELIGTLQAIDRTRVSWAEVTRGERLYLRHELPKHSPVIWVQSIWKNVRILRSSRVKHEMCIARVRLMAVELAIRSYEVDNGRPPKGLSELVPRYLEDVPTDPFQSRSSHLAYRMQGSTWLLYSVGPDGVDDGGVRGPRGAAKGDVFFDSM